MELIDNLKLKEDFIGSVFYESLGGTLTRVNDEKGTFQRHIVNNEKHGVFHVITPALPKAFEYDQELVLVGEPTFLEDRTWNGSDVAPALNVRVAALKEKGGN